jgi:hypothetical protein
VGTQVNGSTLIDTLTLEPLEVLEPANVTVAGIDIVPPVVRQNQDSVEVRYTLQNEGNSTAFIRNLLPHFTRAMDAIDVSGDWVLSSITPELQDTLGAGNARLYNAFYVLGAQADTGMITPYPEVQFNDVLTANFVDTSNTSTAFDSVRVIQPAALRIDHLVLDTTLSPNKPRLNINESFNLQLAVSNLGADSANSVAITLQENGADRGQYMIPTLAPYSSDSLEIALSVSVPNPYSYTARIDSAFDATTGERVSVAQPLDNREDINADEPALLNITSFIARPGGALDGIVSVGQQFEIDATTTNDGTAPYSPGLLRLSVPANYSLLTPDTIRYTESNPVITWRVQSNDTTVSTEMHNWVCLPVRFRLNPWCLVIL